jgi:PAS domain S-box-containing protein
VSQTPIFPILGIFPEDYNARSLPEPNSMHMELPGENSIDFRSLIEGMTESVLITTPDLNLPGPFIIYANPAFEKMTGWKKEEVIGKNPRILQGSNTDYGIFRDMRETLEKGEIWSGRTINYKKDGSEFYMEWSIVPIRDPQGIIFQYLAVQNDVSAIVRTERKLAQARQEEKKRLLEIEEANQKLSKLIARQKKTLDLFVKYVPASIVKDALSNKENATTVNLQLEVALLFCDIRGFTGIVETLNPSETVHHVECVLFQNVRSDHPAQRGDQPICGRRNFRFLWGSYPH